MQPSEKARRESWIQFALLLLILVSSLLWNERRITKIEVLLEHHLTEYERIVEPLFKSDPRLVLPKKR